MNSSAPSPSFLRINRPQVAFESFGDETLLVNLDSGFYYSLQGCSGRVLALVERGCDVDTIIASVQRANAGDPTEIAAQITRFLAELTAESILGPGALPAAGSAGPTAEDAPGTVASRPPFQPPAIEKFSDMQDLLLLDPIHEVDEMGWPHQPVRE